MSADFDNKKGTTIKFVITPEPTPESTSRNYGEEIEIQEISQDSEDNDPGNKNFLAPDHPFLAKFQKVLKDHLTRQVEHLSNEVFEYETGAKKRSSARQNLGIETYEAQQLVNKQQQDLEMCVSELQEICEATEQMEDHLDQSKETFNKTRNELLELEQKELHLRREVEGLNLLLNQMKEWEHEVESELVISQKVLEKSKKDKLKLSDEKRQLDMFIYKLMTETWRLEEELETMDMQLRVKEDERERLANAVTNSNVEVETMNAEYRCLLHSWNSIIVAIAQRDKQHTSVKQELDAINEKINLANAEIEQTKKLCHKEMMQNERLTDLKGRLEVEIDNCKRLYDSETKKRELIENEMSNNQMIMDQIERDLKRMSAECANKANILSLTVKTFENVNRDKVNIEHQILQTLDEQLTNNKAAQYLNKLVFEIKEKNADFEITLAKLENSNAKVLMDIEAMKCANSETQRLLDDLIKQQEAGEAEVKAQTNDFDRMIFLANRKQRQIEVLNSKINRIVSNQGGVEASPEEIKIVTLEKDIGELRDKIKELQKFWLRQQGHVVSLSEQRQDQINDINMLKKRMMLLIQRNLKLSDELEGYKKLEDKMNRNINNLQNRLIVLNDALCKKKGCKQSMVKNNDSIQSEYMSRLKDAELEAIKIDSDITDIEEDKLNLSKELIEHNREALVWEKKILMTVETRQNMEKEKGEGGEVGNMKSEIHRMHVRFSQLRKAQDKLMHDLEHCVSRRDAIITLAEAREKREKGGSERTRINFTRKLDDMRNRVQQLENDVVTLENKMDVAMKEAERLDIEISMSKREKNQVNEECKKMEYEIELSQTEKQKNLETLVIKQKKLKIYSELYKKRYPYIVYKTESSISVEYEKQQEINCRLVIIVENLTTDFPTHLQVLTRIHNTLTLPFKYL